MWLFYFVSNIAVEYKTPYLFIGLTFTWTAGGKTLYSFTGGIGTPVIPDERYKFINSETQFTMMIDSVRILEGNVYDCSTPDGQAHSANLLVLGK